MATITLEYDGRNTAFKKLLEALLAINFCKIVEHTETKSHYNPEFVKKIQRSEKSKGVKIKTEELWK